MTKKMIDAFLYIRNSFRDFEKVKPRIRETNRIMTVVLSFFAIILIAVIFLLSFKSTSIRQNRIVYGAGLLTSIVVFAISSTVATKHSWLVLPLVHVSYAIYYIYGILIGIVTDPAGKTVTFIALVVFMPTLFINRPINIFIINALYVVAFSALCFQVKEGSVLFVDILDAVVFGALGAASGVVVSGMKVHGYVSEKKLDEIGRIDQLTQVRNRNAYELENKLITNYCKYSIGCLYVDVNGLHELNNSEGHETGDTMLKFVAKEIKKRFDEKFVYRIGGDEFIAFVTDPSRKVMEQKAKELSSSIEEEGYYIATGIWIDGVNQTTLNNLVNMAEGMMSKDKEAYYRNITDRETRNRN